MTILYNRQVRSCLFVVKAHFDNSNIKVGIREPLSSFNFFLIDLLLKVMLSDWSKSKWRL